MADAQLIGFTRGDLVSSGVRTAPYYARLVLDRVAVTSDRSWLNAVRAVSDQLPGTRLAVVVTPATALASDSKASMVLRLSADVNAAGKTIGDLINAIGGILDSWGFNEAAVRSLEKTTLAPQTKLTAGNDAAVKHAADDDKKAADAGPFAALLDRFKALGSVTYWVVVALLVVGGGILLFQLYQTTGAARKAAALL